MKSRILLTAAVVAGGGALLIACTTIAQIGTEIGVATGALTEEEAASINRTAEAIERTWQDITPEQEYYIGRSVAATILQRYPAADDPAANEYLNLVGQTLAMASDRPETFGGYHFLLLESDEINAFAAPGGFVLVSRGLVNCCQTEDELAAVLAHEIGHIQNNDGLRAIKQSRLTSALTILGVEAARNLGDEELAALVNEFEGSITDVTSTLVESGYARGQEYDADLVAQTLLERVGYDSHGLCVMLGEMERRWNPSGLGFERTHPTPSNRIERLETDVTAAIATPEARQARFISALGQR